MKTGGWVVKGSSTHGENPTTTKVSIPCDIEHKLD